MLVFVQPYGLNSPGGGPRIFRSLLQDSPVPFLSVCTSPQSPPPTTIAQEIHLPIRPNLGRIEQTRLGRYSYLIESLFVKRFEQRLSDLCVQHRATGIHAIAHSVDFWYAYRVAQRLGLPYYLTVHDDLAYALRNRLEQKFGMAHIGEAWANAAERFVISKEMGEEYCRRYGQKSWTIVTDGLIDIPAVALTRPPKHLKVYFMGAIHLTYEANFCALLEALNQFQQSHSDWSVSLTIRGGVPFHLNSPTVAIKLLPWGSQTEVANDLEQADALYMPLPFGSETEAFVKYSLSTKMVTYLGSGLPILYHGPAIAAAGQLLKTHNAAILADSLDPAIIEQSIEAAQPQITQIVENALQLGRSQFSLEEVRSRFWKPLQSEKVAVCS